MPDLFDNLARKRVGRLFRQGHRGAGRAGAGAAPARHVYRRHRRAGAAPPRRRGARQRHGRGGRPATPSRIELELHADGSAVGARQRPRHPGRSASEIPARLGARGHPDHAAFGRQVLAARPTRPRAGCTASASRWSTRCPSGSRSRSARDGCVWRQDYRARQAQDQAQGRRRRRATGAAPTVRFHPDPEIFGDDAALQAGAALSHGALQGLSVPRRRDPLVVRRRALPRPDDVPQEERFHFPGGLADYPRPSRRRARDRDAASRSPASVEFRARPARVEWAIAWPAGFGEATASPLLLQHRADARGRHARGGPARGADARPQGLWRADRQQARAPQITAEDVMAGAVALLSRLHPQPAVPGPDQGAAVLDRGPAAGRRRAAAIRSTTG